MTRYTTNHHAKPVNPVAQNAGRTRRPAGLRVQTHLKAGESIRLNFTK
jgi:hypothetical protein